MYISKKKKDQDGTKLHRLNLFILSLKLEGVEERWIVRKKTKRTVIPCFGNSYMRLDRLRFSQSETNRAVKPQGPRVWCLCCIE